MQIRVKYVWDRAKASANLQKHGVSFESARDVFSDEHILTKYDVDTSLNEERWISIGLSANSNPVLVVYTYNDYDFDDHVVRIISARKPTRREAQAYWMERLQ